MSDAYWYSLIPMQNDLVHNHLFHLVSFIIALTISLLSLGKTSSSGNKEVVPCMQRSIGLCH